MTWEGITFGTCTVEFDGSTRTLHRSDHQPSSCANCPRTPSYNVLARQHQATRGKAYTGLYKQKPDQTLPWPAKSPDLNPIENLLDELNHRLEKRVITPRNLNELAQAL